MLRTFFLRMSLVVYAIVGSVGFLFLTTWSQLPGLAPAVASAHHSSTTQALANLQHTPTGTANLTYHPDTKSLIVTISLTGLAPNSTHPAHIHLGSCENPNPGTIKYMLLNVVSDKTGNASYTTILSNISGGIPATGWYINVHNGPNLMPANQYTPIACGDIHNPAGLTSVLAPLGASPSPNESAYGLTKLALVHGVLTVTTTVHGLVPHSSHMAHIHAGNCFYTKQVLYDFSPLVADANGNVTKTVKFSGVHAIPTTGWDVNVHYSTDLSTQTGYNPVLCGNVVPA